MSLILYIPSYTILYILLLVMSMLPIILIMYSYIEFLLLFSTKIQQYNKDNKTYVVNVVYNKIYNEL